MTAWEWLPAEPVPTRPMDLDGVEATPEWYADAACQDTDPETFFPEAGRYAAVEALAVCMPCPARLECLDYALSLDPSADFGVWGGTTLAERRTMRRSQRAGQAPVNLYGGMESDSRG